MSDERKIRSVISTAIFEARMKYPHIEPGVTWDDSYNSDQKIGAHLAGVIIKELNLAGFQISQTPPIVPPAPTNAKK